LCSFFNTLILVYTFRSFVRFGSTNREASTKGYTHALFYLFFDASLQMKICLDNFLSVYFNSYRSGSSVVEGSKVSEKYIWSYGFCLSRLGVPNRSRCSSWKSDSSKNLWLYEWF